MHPNYPPGYPPGYPQQPSYPNQPQQQPWAPQQPGYPQQPSYPQAPPGYPQHPQQPPAPQWAPTQPQQGAPPMPPGFGAPPMPHQPAAYPPAGAVPSFYIPSPAEMAAMQARASAEQARLAALRAGGGSKKGRDLKFPGPGGADNWRGATIGYEASLHVRIMPSPVQGMMYFLEAPKHFWKSTAHPRGFGGWCSGQGCQLCAAIEKALGSSSDDVQKRAKMARVRTHRLYQVFAYELGQKHLDEVTGRYKPLLWDVPFDVHSKFSELIGARGLHTFLDLSRGAPFKVTRKKTGVEEQNIDYSVIDMLNLAGPLPPSFGIGPNGEGLELLDLRKFAKVMTLEDQAKAVQELGFTVDQPYSYSQAPQAPSPSPYEQQPQAPQQPWAPQGQLPSVGGQYGQPQQPPQAPPPAWAPPAQPQAPQGGPPGWGAPQQWGQPSGPPPVLPSTGQPPPGSYAQPRDPWAEPPPGHQQPPGPGEAPPGWTPPAPPAASQAPQWGAPQPPQQPAQWGPQAQAPSGMPPELAALEAQMRGQAQPPAAGPGPAYGPPPGLNSAPPPR